MKRFFIAFLAVTLSFCACSDPGVRKGDIIFVGIPRDDAPGEYNYVHAAILDVDADGAVMVIDATLKRGVDRHPLDSFLVDFTRHDGSYPLFEIMRLADNSQADEFVTNACSYIGEEYDVDFAGGNGKHYCTELIYDSYVSDGNHIFTEGPLSFSDPDGTLHPYWEHYFSKLGISVPDKGTGTTPAEMRRSPVLRPVDFNLLSLKD